MLDISENSDYIEEKYKAACDYLFGRLPMFSRIGGAAYKPGLKRVIALAGYFGNPHKKFKAIHIAGTNGKGSTSHMLSAILQSEGYRTALYTSPHLVDFRERMRIDGKMIPKERVIRFVDEWEEIEKGFNGDAPSFFELTMMLAFIWFAEEGVDFAVIETGMGGRLDSTNIITPILSIITNISFDHRMFLGDTLDAIAGEKGGIIKRGIPVVIGEAKDSVHEVFRKIAADKRSPIFYASDQPAVFNPKSNITDGWRGWSNVCGYWETPLTGSYQVNNINTVLKSIEILRKENIQISDYAVRNGLKYVEKLTGLRGRFTIVRRDPLVICDTGHNEAGLSYNNQQLMALLQKFNSDTSDNVTSNNTGTSNIKDRQTTEESNKSVKSHLHYVVGFVSDKEVDHILATFLKEAHYYVTAASVPRAMPADILFKKFIENGFSATSYKNVSLAYEAAMKNATVDDVIFIGGSTFIVADYLRDLI